MSRNLTSPEPRSITRLLVPLSRSEVRWSNRGIDSPGWPSPTFALGGSFQRPVVLPLTLTPYRYSFPDDVRELDIDTPRPSAVAPGMVGVEKKKRTSTSATPVSRDRPT